MFNIISLHDLMKNFPEEKVNEILLDFKSVPSINNESNDVEHFLHNKSILFEKTGLSTTHLVFDNVSYKLLGYFSLANKPLVMTKKNYNSLSNTKKKHLALKGRRDDDKDYIVSSYLIGQLGKNYKYREELKGIDLLTMAYNHLLEAKRYVSARFVWLECENNEKLLNFYKDFGFEEIENFESENRLKVLIMKLEE